ncbi:hypothetical protein KSP39_PZI000182 [Platanthera zijinensis]|uniref:CCHC-type domain-containing protein n=1 Tax=Platanthera zijinensis TaxID=2320716 RepID=A0AAP0C5Q2_9ASPA
MALKEGTMVDVFKMLGPDELATLLSVLGSLQRSAKLELTQIDLKLDGSTTYLSWSRRVKKILAAKQVGGFLTGALKKPEHAAKDEWESAHMTVFMWLLSSVVPSIVATVDGLDTVMEVWDKLKNTYDSVRNTQWVFRMKGEIDDTAQGEKTVQEYDSELERLWVDYNHTSSRMCCRNSQCRASKIIVEERTMKFLKGLDDKFNQRRALLLSGTTIPTLTKAISAMIQNETRLKLQAGAGGSTTVKSALAVTAPDITGQRGETRKCYNCGEVGNLRQACPMPPKERNLGCGRGRGRGGREGYRANLGMTENEEEVGVIYTEGEQTLLSMLKGIKRKQMGEGSGDGARGVVMYAQPPDGPLALASISSSRASDWIIDSDASRHVTGNTGEFSSYTRITTTDSIQTTEGTFQPMVSKGTVNCSGSVKLSNVLHAPYFPVNLLSISFMIIQLKCVVSFDIPKVTFQDKGTMRILGTGTWHDGLWYLDREGLDAALVSVVEKTGVRGR